jgi:hypothetical protein
MNSLEIKTKYKVLHVYQHAMAGDICGVIIICENLNTGARRNVTMFDLTEKHENARLLIPGDCFTLVEEVKNNNKRKIKQFEVDFECE